MNTGPLWSSFLTQVFWFLHFLCFESERREQGVDMNQLQPSVLENDTNMVIYLFLVARSKCESVPLRTMLIKPTLLH